MVLDFTEDKTQQEMEWQEPLEIQEGKHTGAITKVEYKTEPFAYTDIFVKLDDVDIEIKYGCPTSLTPKSKLGRVLVALGEEYEKGKKINVGKVLTGKRITFMTINKKEKDGREYARIIEDSIKPLK